MNACKLPAGSRNFARRFPKSVDVGATTRKNPNRGQAESLQFRQNVPGYRPKRGLRSRRSPPGQRIQESADGIKVRFFDGRKVPDRPENLAINARGIVSVVLQSAMLIDDLYRAMGAFVNGVQLILRFQMIVTFVFVTGYDAIT